MRLESGNARPQKRVRHGLPVARPSVSAVVIALAACGPQADAPPNTGAGSGEEAAPGPSVAIVGDTALLELPVGRSGDNGEIVIDFDGVTEDSRCPRDVQCVWEGNAGVRLTLTSDEETQVVIVNSALEPRQVSFAGYTIGLRDLRPYPVSGEAGNRDAYVATIAVFDAW